MKPRIVNPIRYAELEPEIRLGLDRYLLKLQKATGERWKVEHLYKPTKWCRARLASSGGDGLVIWYRSKRNYWTVIKTYGGRGFLCRRRGPPTPNRNTDKLIAEALEQLKAKLKSSTE